MQEPFPIIPKILLADEPTGALDSKSGAQIMELFQSLHEEGVTIIMITHDSELHHMRSVSFTSAMDRLQNNNKIWQMEGSMKKLAVYILVPSLIVGSCGAGVYVYQKNKQANTYVKLFLSVAYRHPIMVLISICMDRLSIISASK